MKIRDIQALGLRGDTPEGGWSNEIEAEDNVHTLIFVHTDEDVTGIGSVFTSDTLRKRRTSSVGSPLPGRKRTGA